MDQRFVSLHDMNAPKRAKRTMRKGFGPNVFASGEIMAEAPPALEVRTGALDTTDVADASNDPTTIALARVMPLKLHKPVAKRPAAAATSWGLEAIGALQDSKLDGRAVTVAVLDTGIDDQHPAFNGVELECKNFTSEADGDSDGHGTHCAGTIFGRDVGTTRIGIARGVRRALIGKVIGADANTETLINAMKWAFDGGAHVISMSLGYDHVALLKYLRGRMPEDRAIGEVLVAYQENIRLFDRLMALLAVPRQDNHGAIVVAASGNESKGDDAERPFRISAACPSTAEGVIAVGALAKLANGKFGVAPFSNTNVEIAAPGVDIISAKLGGGLVEMSGTSMACPHVAGVAALHWSDVMARQLPVKAEIVSSRMIGAAVRSGIDSANSTIADFGVGVARVPA